ncbi:hypothetical protein [Streptomyces sp. NPDC087297]|uniref:hypothetical protein n=1 Tax=Streptomyces sp. NPDC087297 TaxID=3365778 RepID=UPI00380D6280
MLQIGSALTWAQAKEEINLHPNQSVPEPQDSPLLGFSLRIRLTRNDCIALMRLAGTLAVGSALTLLWQAGAFNH